MDSDETNTHSFIVKIWLEEAGDDAGRITWRGYVTHVQSGERRYIQDFNGVTEFIAPYLERMGARVDISRRVKRWLNRQRLFLTRKG